MRTGLAKTPQDWPWSSAQAHLGWHDDELAKVTLMLERIGDWRGFLDGRLAADEGEAMRLHENPGRPLGSEGFVARLEAALDRVLGPRKPGPKPRKEGK